ncbi:MAG: glycosyltransferase [Cyanobacteria bacterium P01_A01_bin.84]
MTLSLCAIARNEAATLPLCLGSVKGVVDEIILLDTGSVDGTPQIAEELGAKVYRYEWCNDFSAARNEALKYVTSDWVLVLDADETLNPEIVPVLRQVMEMEEYLLVNLLRQEIGAKQSPYSLVSRLFRNRDDIRFSRPYHALVDDSVEELIRKESYWQIGQLPGVAIFHTGYQKDSISQKNKSVRAEAAMEEFLAVNPSDAYVCSKLGGLYIETGKVTEGIKLLEQGLENPDIDDQIKYELHYHLGIGYTRAKYLKKAVANYQEAIKLLIDPMLKLGAYNNLGNLLKTVGNFKAAKTAYETAIKLDPNFAMGYFNLGATYKEMGLLPNAIVAYRKAIQVDSSYGEAYQNLGLVLMKAGYIQDSKTAFRSAIAIYQQQNPNQAKELQRSLEEIGFQV